MQVSQNTHETKVRYLRYPSLATTSGLSSDLKLQGIGKTYKASAGGSDPIQSRYVSSAGDFELSYLHLGLFWEWKLRIISLSYSFHIYITKTDQAAKKAWKLYTNTGDNVSICLVKRNWITSNL